MSVKQAPDQQIVMVLMELCWQQQKSETNFKMNEMQIGVIHYLVLGWDVIQDPGFEDRHAVSRVCGLLCGLKRPL